MPELGWVNYASAHVPERYRCGACQKHGCKLWRPSHVCLEDVHLKCCDCAGKSEDRDIRIIDVDGKYEDSLGCHSDQIGNYVPAVPTEDGTTFWGYTSVPQPGVAWWRRLPTRV